ncbi:MAG: DUF3014 domain-containing protein [Acidimicrobiia bacterium]|nr:DUF3014 domain-containing protein [Acidimicrobiia bacterium]
MADGHDFDLELDDEPGGVDLLPPDPPQRTGLWIGAALVVVALGGLLAWYLLRDGSTGPSDVAGVPEPELIEPAPAEAGIEPLVAELPGLDVSDDLVRRLIAMFSQHPRLTTWFATDNIIRGFAAVVANVADGESPAPHLQRLRPVGPFQVAERAGTLTIDPRSFQRYTVLTDVATSIDPAGAARVYLTLKPLIEEAYADLGYPEPSFDRTLERAIARLLATPVPEGAIAVEPEGGTEYRFVREDLQQLSPAGKQLVRFGPANQQRLQAHLRAIAAAIGIPAERLRAPRQGPWPE